MEQMKRSMFRTVVRYGLALVAGMLLVLLAPQIIRFIQLVTGHQ